MPRGLATVSGVSGGWPWFKSAGRLISFLAVNPEWSSSFSTGSRFNKPT
jgi:hypothetical protein